jgi:carboxyl-terminal processing protease
MSEVKKSLLAAGAVIAASGMVVLGAQTRARVDGVPLPATGLGNLVASRGTEDVQVNVPASDFYNTLADKLRREYVEPVDDEMKLATGAVRGMVGSLADPRSLYMDAKEFRAFLNARQGEYEGIGADFVLAMPKAGKASKDFLQPTGSDEEAPMAAPAEGEPRVPSVPRLTVVSVVPGGPADRAGVKPGDIVDTVNGHWIYNSAELQRFRDAQKRFAAKQMTLDEINKLRNDLRTKFESAILPLRAKSMLFLGTSGELDVVWSRGKAQRTTKLARAASERTGFEVEGDTIELPLTAETPDRLREAIQGKSAVTLDLRNNVHGDFEVMRKVLAILAPSGTYGTLAKAGKAGDRPLKVETGNAKPPKLTLLVDSSTRGAAEILALALNSKGLAKLSGGATGGDRAWYEVMSLPDGSGYTLVTAEYKALPLVKKATTKKEGSR